MENNDYIQDGIHEPPLKPPRTDGATENAVPSTSVTAMGPNTDPVHSTSCPPGAMATRSAEFWFSDGNIVLQAGTQIFRVHQSILLRESALFDEMLTIPQEPNVEALDGCPVVRLWDQPEDITNLLRLLYNGARYYHARIPIPLSFLVSVISVGYKYQMEDVLQSALSHLESCFPNRVNTSGSWLGDESSVVNRRVGDAIVVVNLARLVGANHLLPTALLRCALLPYPLLLSGLSEEHLLDKCPVPLRLSDEDIVLCLKGKDMLRAEIIKTVTALYDEGNLGYVANCQGGSQCRSAFSKMGKLRMVSEDRMQAYLAFKPLVNDADRMASMCGDCWVVLQRKEELTRRVIWAKLPEIMGVSLDKGQWAERVGSGGP